MPITFVDEIAAPKNPTLTAYHSPLTTHHSQRFLVIIGVSLVALDWTTGEIRTIGKVAATFPRCRKPPGLACSPPIT
jgi:hypothetical protein